MVMLIIVAKREKFQPLSVDILPGPRDSQDRQGHFANLLHYKKSILE